MVVTGDDALVENLRHGVIISKNADSAAVELNVIEQDGLPPADMAARLENRGLIKGADIAVLVSATLPKGCSRFTLTDGVVVTDFACAGALAAVLRANLLQLAQARTAASNKEEKLELLYRYLSGVEFRQRVEAVVEAFAAMRQELEQERRAAERQWARRSRQIEAVTFNISGMYGDLQGLLPALPPIAQLELSEAVES